METSHILIAEDDPDTRELMEVVLRRAGFRVTATGDPYEALELLATDSVAALLLDYWMPKLNGIELCRLIRSANHNVVIVFCSGSVADLTNRLLLPLVLRVLLASLFTRRTLQRL